MKRAALLILFPLLAIGCFWALWRYLWSAFFNTGKAWNVAKMIDETANVGANGSVNVTISARAARARNAGRRWGCCLCRVLDWVQKGHCDDALKSV